MKMNDIFKGDLDIFGVGLFDADGLRVADFNYGSEQSIKSKAAAIAINNHDELVSALLFCRDRLESVYKNTGSAGASRACEMADEILEKIKNEI